MQRFGEKIRRLRQRDSMTLQQLSELLGYSDHTHLSRIESGRKKPSTELVIQLSRVFSVTTDDLLFDERDTAD